MAIAESYCMPTTPEKDKTTPGKAGIEEDSAAPENANPEATDQQSEKQDTPRKEELENDGEDDYIPTPPNGPETDTRNDTHAKKEEEESENETKSIALEQTEHAPRSEHTEQSEMGGSLAVDSETDRQEEIVIIPQESEEGPQPLKKKSRSEYTPIRRSSQEPTRNQQRLSIPETRNNHSNTPTNSDLVSSISVSNRSGKSVVRTIEVPIDTTTSETRTSDGEQDGAMAAKKRDRSPSPETKKREQSAEKKEREQDRIAAQEKGKRERERPLQKRRETEEEDREEKEQKTGAGEKEKKERNAKEQQKKQRRHEKVEKKEGGERRSLGRPEKN